MILMNKGIITTQGTPNIALIKYWGKRDTKLILPMNSSISLTLDSNSKKVFGKSFELYTRTSVVFSKKIDADMFYMNGEMQDLTNKDTEERFRVVDVLREMAGITDRVMVVSKNAFPTASGLASSASGIAALIYAASEALDLKLSQKEMSIVARQGSGSACRSMFGGIVKWNKGIRSDGKDSYAEQLYPENYWPELTDVIAIASSVKKKIPSRAGMSQTVSTSSLYKERIGKVDSRIKALEKAIKEKDFHTFAEIIMTDSNNMHATMLDTYPPIIYMNDVSREVIYAVHELNERSGENICGYTFDAGANPQIITTKGNVNKVIDVLKKINGLESVFYTGVGGGPKILDESYSLIDKNSLVLK